MVAASVEGGKEINVYMRKRTLVLSLGYWFSSRSLGLLLHPYATVRVLVREKFLRPLVGLPGVVWMLSWMVGIVLVRVGMYFELGRFGYIYEVGLGLVFLWLWVSVFLLIWQSMLLYLYIRFKRVLR